MRQNSIEEFPDDGVDMQDSMYDTADCEDDADWTEASDGSRESEAFIDAGWSDFAIEVDEEDLEWDLPDTDALPDLDPEEAAAWEDGELALLQQNNAMCARSPEEIAADGALYDPQYAGDEAPESVTSDTDRIPAIDMDRDMESDTDRILVADMDLLTESDTEPIPAAYMDADTDALAQSDTDLIPIVDTEEIAGTDVLEIHEDSEEAQSAREAQRRPARMDYAIRIAGVIAAALAIAVGIRLYQAMEVRAETAQYQTLGESLAGTAAIGEDQIEAIADARVQRDADRAAAAEAAAEAERQAAEKAELAANEGTVPVTMALSTVQSDLKIKIRGESGSLISGVPFKVTVGLPSGKTGSYEDEDQDGVIYLTSLSKGTYKVTMDPLVTEPDDGMDVTDTEEYRNYSQYRIPTDTQSIAVTDQIAYAAIDVSDEIKSASQVNVAAEDTQQKIATESALQDTVEYVESTTATTSEDALYEVVDKGDIVEPGVSASANRTARHFRMLAEDTSKEATESADEDTTEAAAISEENTEENAGGDSDGGNTQDGNAGESDSAGENSGESDSGDSENDGEQENTKRAYTTTIKGNTSVAEGGTTVLTASTDEPGATTYTWEAEGDAVELDRTSGKTVTVTGMQEGSADIRVTAHLVAEDADPSENVVSTQITVTAAEETSEKQITVSPASVTLAPGRTQALSVTLEGVSEDGVTYESAESLIAEVSDDGVITAHTAGETTITVTADADSSLKQSIRVKVAETETNADGSTLLKDKDGNQIYVKDNGAYREATAADYHVFDTFYRKVEGKVSTGEFKYTGWQNIGGKTYYFNSAGEPVTGSQVINGASYTFGSDGALTSGTSKVGIDVSQWNGSISWPAVSSSGISYAIIRCGYRGSSSGALIRDPNFTTNIAGATAAGLKVGIYVFSQAVNEVEAVEEASMAIELAAGYSVSLPIFIDVEAAGGRADGLSVSQRTAVVSAFCQTVQAAGYTAGIYSNTNWLSERVNTPALTSYHIWVAQYASSLSYARTRYDIWQYSSKGHVAGITGDVDMNMAYRSY